MGRPNVASPLARSTSPPTFTYLDKPVSGLLRPSHSSSRTYTIKLAGPGPLVRLPGGRPSLTLLAEQDKQSLGQYTSFVNNQTGTSSVTFTPARSQRVDSFYGELTLPIVGARIIVPLVRELELQVAGRWDRYTGIGSNSNLTCFPLTSTPWSGPLPADAYNARCPQNGSVVPTARTRNSSTNPTVALRWAISPDIAFRGSYSTGYLPPFLNSVVATPAGVPGTLLAGKTIVNVTDPLRGNERIGQPLLGIFQILPATIGGNANIHPQTSRTLSFGAVLTPRFVPGFRFSVDWSRIVEDNVYYQPSSLLGSGNAVGGQQVFNDFLAAYPGRFTRDTNPATFGSYNVGPIIAAG